MYSTIEKINDKMKYAVEELFVCLVNIRPDDYRWFTKIYGQYFLEANNFLVKGRKKYKIYDRLNNEYSEEDIINMFYKQLEKNANNPKEQPDIRRLSKLAIASDADRGYAIHELYHALSRKSGKGEFIKSKDFSVVRKAYGELARKDCYDKVGKKDESLAKRFENVDIKEYLEVENAYRL